MGYATHSTSPNFSLLLDAQNFLNKTNVTVIVHANRANSLFQGPVFHFMGKRFSISFLDGFHCILRITSCLHSSHTHVTPLQNRQLLEGTASISCKYLSYMLHARALRTFGDWKTQMRNRSQEGLCVSSPLSTPRRPFFKDLKVTKIHDSPLPPGLFQLRNAISSVTL